MLHSSDFARGASALEYRDALVWPTRANPVLAWLANETCGECQLENIFFDLCRRLETEGVPISRASVFFRIDHPQWSALHVLWCHGMNQPKVVLSAHGRMGEDPFREAALGKLDSKGREFRLRLHDRFEAGKNKGLSECMQREGLADYVAWPLQFSLGKRHLISFATSKSSGFSDDDLLDLAELLPVLASIMEIRLKDRLARDLFDVYLGRHAGEAIRAGATRRGDGVTVEAAVMVMDLRGFTSISEQWPRDDLIAMLNEYFDAVSDPIERHGGEILKFMGDGLLAIFPGNAAAAIKAVVDIWKAMTALNGIRETRGARALQFGVGVNYGDVMCGNIGSRNRLDFTVIGPTVNVAARLEELTKAVGHSVLFSGAFVAKAGECLGLECLGECGLRGVDRPVQVYGFCPSTHATVLSMQL